MSLRFVIDARHIKDFGIGTHIRNLVHSLAAIDRENRYVLVTSNAGLPEVSGLGSNFETAVYERRDTDPLDQVAFPLFLKHFSADLIHIPLSVVSIALPKPYLVTVHDLSSLLFEERQSRWRSLARFQFRRGLLRADRVIVVSRATQRNVEDLFGVPPGRIRLVYNAPDPKFLQPGPQADARAAGLETPSSELRRTLERYQIQYPFILYAGTIRPQKNIPRLVEAFAVVRGALETHPVYKDLRLIIIGDEISKYPAVRRAVIQTRAENVVRFLGFVPFDTLRMFYEAAAAFVFPSLYEGFGLPPLEAMASGTPVVTSNVSSLPEVVGDAAVLVNPENVFDIARGIREVLTDDDLRAELIRKGHDQTRRFSWESTARQVLEIYLDVIAERTGSARTPSMNQ